MTVTIPTMPRPAESDLAALAESVGYALPASYLKFVKLHDGASPAHNSIKISDNEVSVSRFIRAAEACTLGSQIDGFPVGTIPFAEDDSGNYFYVAPSDGAVFFWDHEVEGGDKQIAESASCFVEFLMPFDTAAKLAPGQVIRKWVNPSFKPEF